MSQVLFSATTNQKDRDPVPVEVMAGWDRPTRAFFMTLFDRDEGGPLWSTLDESPTEIGLGTTHYIRDVLKDFGVEPPDGFWERVERKEANVMHEFMDGAWTDRTVR